MQIACRPAARIGHAAAADAKDLARLRARRNGQLVRSGERGHFDRRAQGRLAVGDRHSQDQVRAFALEELVLLRPATKQ